MPGDQSHGTHTETTYHIPPLPHVVWRCIAAHLGDKLPTLLHLAAFSRDLQEICRPHISSHFQEIKFPVAPLPPDFYYHRLVQLVLEGYIDPSSILELHRWADYSHRFSVPQRFSGRVTGADDVATAHPTRKCDGLVREAVEECAYLSVDIKAEACRRFQQGDPDAALAILLHLCTKLKMIEIEGSSSLCASVFKAVARAYHQQGTGAEEARQKAWDAALRDRSGSLGRKTQTWCKLPLSELLVIVVEASRYEGYSFELIELVPFMGIPSLHRMVLGAVRDHTFSGWPTEIVGCSCPEVYLQQSGVTKRAALAFAEGVHAPCEIKQWFEFDADYNDSDLNLQVDWDHVLIASSLDGSKTISARLDFDGGNPGYNHAWVSWLWHGKMQDWRRLDEAFKMEDGDSDTIELQGSLG